MKKTYEQKLFALVLVLLAIVLVSSSKSNPAIDRWRKLKFGLFIHWGIFSQLSDKVNITSSDVSSWPIEWESRSWSNNLVKTKDDMKKFREFYWGMSKTFNPSKFDPNKWADYAWKAGMRYIVMTTKHHDGFSMYKTELDDYSVVGSECPFKVDAFGESMKAFKKKGFTLGAYYSKADWHRKDFWKPEIFGDTRHINYDPKKYPDTWASFRSFTQGQIHEIGKLYKPDILWFDGGWIKPTYEDLRWDEIAEDARKINPEVIIVNRQGGYYEDYITPEQGGIPDVPLVKPWELCQTMTSQWSFKRGEKYKDTKEILSTLLSVVAKGGSYLLDIGPTAEGEFAPEAVQRLEELAEWMKVNEEGIHDSEPVAPYTFSVMITNSTAEVPFFLTRKAEFIYVYCMYDILPPKIYMPFIRREGMGDLSPFSLLDMKLLGSDSKLKFTYENDGLVVYLPKDIDPPGRHAFGFKLLLE